MSRPASIFIVLVALVALSSLAVSAQAAPPGQTRLGFSGGDDWEPAIAADSNGHVYVIWPQYGGRRAEEAN